MSTAATIYQRQRRAAAVANKQCIQCCRRPQHDGRSRCAECLGMQGATDASRRHSQHVPHRVNWCVACQAANFHRAECPADARGAA